MRKVLKWGLIGLGILIVIGIIANLGGGGGKKAGKEEPATKEVSKKKPVSKSEVKTVALNQDIQIGEVRWKVLEVNKTEAIEQQFGEPTKASGVFVIVKLEAELTGKKSGTIDANQLIVIDSQDREFEHSTEAQTALTMSKGYTESLFLKQVNPNVPVSGWAAFDIAKDAASLKLKIKDLRMFSSAYGYVELGI